MIGGWVKLHRKFIEWEWYDDINTKVLFIHCLIKANYKDKKWRGNLIEKGSFITSLSHLAQETGLSVRQVRTSLDKLESTGEIDKATTSLNTCITITNYNDYQEVDKVATSERQTNDKRATTTKNINNIKKEKNNVTDQKIVDVISDVDEIEDKNILLALHIWNDVNDLIPNNKTTLNAKVGNWSEPIRLMVERDDRTYEGIWALWKRVQRDDFWSKNVLCTEKLRKQFDHLSIKLNKNGKANSKKIDSVVDSLYGG